MFCGHSSNIGRRYSYGEPNTPSQIEHRLEVLEGYLVAYLNLDEVIRIIREEDEPKAIMMKKWKLTDVQAEAILNMRLRASPA